MLEVWPEFCAPATPAAPRNVTSSTASTAPARQRRARTLRARRDLMTPPVPVRRANVPSGLELLVEGSQQQRRSWRSDGRSRGPRRVQTLMVSGVMTGSEGGYGPSYVD